MEINSREALILGNFIVCLAGAGVAICRMGRMNRWDTKWGVQMIYLGYLLLFMSSSISYWWGDDPTRIQVIMGAIVLGALLIGFPAWRGGAPAHTYKRFGFVMDYLKHMNGARRPVVSDAPEYPDW